MSGQVVAFYVASPGYLFQTAVSALQARTALPADGRVIVFFVGGGSAEESSELAAFARVLTPAGVELRELARADLRGLAFTYSRFFAAAAIEPDAGNLLYLDGDTQVLSSLLPLVDQDPGADVLAALDPMVAIRRAGGRLAVKVDSIFDASDVPTEVRERYVNAGVLFARRDTLVEIGEWSVRAVRGAGRDFPFRDQDAINLGFRDRVRTVSTRWNFPGFWLGTPAASQCRPAVVHFMSNPRPWFGVHEPFGAGAFEPYATLAARHPELVRYWDRPRGRRALKSRAVGLYKHVLETPHWRSGAMTAAITGVEAAAGSGSAA